MNAASRVPWVIANAGAGVIVAFAPDPALIALVVAPGLAQAVVLRDMVPAWRWAIASVIGTAVGFAFAYSFGVLFLFLSAGIVNETSGEVIALLTLGIAGGTGAAGLGLLLGAAQALAAGGLLGRGRWIALTVIACIATSPLLFTFGGGSFMVGPAEIPVWAVRLPFGLLYGYITAPAVRTLSDTREGISVQH